jgi:hypothetical protein
VLIAGERASLVRVQYTFAGDVNIGEERKKDASCLGSEIRRRVVNVNVNEWKSRSMPKRLTRLRMWTEEQSLVIRATGHLGHLGLSFYVSEQFTDCNTRT